MYLSPVSFEKLGFPTLGAQPVTTWSETAMIATPGVIVGAVGILSGIYWITKRRMELGNQASGTPDKKEK